MANRGTGRIPRSSVSDAANRALVDTQSDAARTKSAQGLLGRLERGEISREAYLDLRIENAIAPFARSLDKNQLEFMRVALRDQLESDPMLVDLVRQATSVATGAR